MLLKYTFICVLLSNIDINLDDDHEKNIVDICNIIFVQNIKITNRSPLAASSLMHFIHLYILEDCSNSMGLKNRKA